MSSLVAYLFGHILASLIKREAQMMKRKQERSICQALTMLNIFDLNFQLLIKLAMIIVELSANQRLQR